MFERRWLWGIRVEFFTEKKEEKNRIPDERMGGKEKKKKKKKEREREMLMIPFLSFFL